MTTISGLILRTDGTVNEIFVDNNLEPLQALVAGYIEVVDIGHDASMILNEEGKLIPLPRNDNATLVARSMTHLAPEDWIAGDVLICGFDRTTGEFTDIPHDLSLAVRLSTAQPGLRLVR